MREPATPSQEDDPVRLRAQVSAPSPATDLHTEPEKLRREVAASPAPSLDQTAEERAEEARRIRRLQLMMNMVMQVIQQDHSLPVEQASEMVADARRAALAMFPDKALAFDLIFWPRLQRLMRERYRMQ